MRRWLWRILVAVSLPMLVGTVAMWIRGQLGSDDFGWGRTDRAAGRVRSFDRHLVLGATGIRAHTAVYSAAAADYDSPRAVATAAWDLRPYAYTRYPGARRHPLDGSFLGFAWKAQTTEHRAAARKKGMQFRPTFPWRLEAVDAEVPWWFLTFCFALAPARAAFTWGRTRRRRPRQQCPACGYDCRATPSPTGPTLKACPECGRELNPSVPDETAAERGR